MLKMWSVSVNCNTYLKNNAIYMMIILLHANYSYSVQMIFSHGIILKSKTLIKKEPVGPSFQKNIY